MELEDFKKVLKEINEFKALLGGTQQPVESESDSVWEVGKTYLIRTVTMTLYGTLTKVTQQELVLDNASWIAWTKRFHDSLRDAEFDEVEPFVNPAIVGRGSIVDATEMKLIKLVQS